MHYACGIKKLDIILEQVNVSQNSRQTIGNIHNGFMPLVNIITERLDNIQKDELRNYLRDKTKLEGQEDKTEN